MHAHLVSYLKDNRDQIIENWLTEAEIPAPDDSKRDTSGAGVVPYAFFENAFEGVLQVVETGSLETDDSTRVQLNTFLGMTCDCKQHGFGGHICIELHESGLKAYMSVFDDEWDTEHEFNPMDREFSAYLINHALSEFFTREMGRCHRKTIRTDCPFVALR